MYIVKLKELSLHWEAKDLLTVNKYNAVLNYINTNFTGEQACTLSETLEKGKEKLEEYLRKTLNKEGYPTRAFEYSVYYSKVDENGFFWPPNRTDNYNRL